MGRNAAYRNALTQILWCPCRARSERQRYVPTLLRSDGLEFDQPL
jgi:hypothetical protein